MATDTQARPLPQIKTDAGVFDLSQQADSVPNPGPIVINMGQVLESIFPDSNIGPVLVGIGEILTIVFDIINELISLFTGRPKEEASAFCAHWLLGAPNFSANLLGVQLMRALKDGIVISTGDPGQRKVLNLMVKQFWHGMLAQGIPQARVGELVALTFSRQVTDTGKHPYPDEFQKPVPSGLYVTGDQRLCDMYNGRIADGKTQKQAVRYVYTNAHIQELLTLTLTATPDPNLPKQALPGIPPPPPGPQPGSNPDPVTCAQLGGYVQQITGALRGLTTAGVIPAGSALDLDLQNIAKAIASNTAPDIGAINSALADLARCTCAGLDSLARSVKSIADKYDTDPALMRHLIAAGYIDKQFTEVTQGVPPPNADAVTRATANDRPLSKWWKDFIAGALLGGVDTGDKATALKIASSGLDAIASQSAAKIASNIITGVLKADFDISGKTFAPIIDAMLKVHRDEIAKFKNVNPGDELVGANRLLTEAIGAGVGAHAAAVAAEALFPLKNLGIGQLSAVMAELAGFAEIMAGIIGPEVESAITVPHKYYINAQARAVLPDLGRSNELYARRLITAAVWKKLTAWNGINPDYEDALLEAAYRPAQPFQLMRGLGILNTDLAPIVESGRFAGYRDSDITAMIDAGKRQGLQSMRTAILNEVIKVASEGLLSDAEIDAQLASVDVTKEAHDLVIRHIALTRLHNQATLHKAELNTAAKGGLITIDQYRNSLSAIGYQAPEVSLHGTTVEFFLDSKARAEQERARATELRKEQDAEVRAAVEGFKRGNVDSKKLALALIAAGMAPALAAGYVALLTAAIEPTVKYGSKLSPFARKQAEQAAEVKAEVQRFKKGIINAAALTKILEGLGFSAAQAAAEVSYLVAQNQPNPPKGSLTR